MNNEPRIEVVPQSAVHPLTRRLAEPLAAFVETAKADPDFETVVTCFEVPTCGVWLRDGRDIPCLAVAHDPEMNSWTVLTASGYVLQFLDGEVF